uniref:Uncharacterized protein n=1 Tax=Rhizophora mucronata TaxID=61149 RepID=A0A2P2N2N7_RHIMU
MITMTFINPTSHWHSQCTRFPHTVHSLTPCFFTKRLPLGDNRVTFTFTPKLTLH